MWKSNSPWSVLLSPLATPVFLPSSLLWTHCSTQFKEKTPARARERVCSDACAGVCLLETTAGFEMESGRKERRTRRCTPLTPHHHHHQRHPSPHQRAARLRGALVLLPSAPPPQLKTTWDGGAGAGRERVRQVRPREGGDRRGRDEGNRLRMETDVCDLWPLALIQDSSRGRRLLCRGGNLRTFATFSTGGIFNWGTLIASHFEQKWSICS